MTTNVSNSGRHRAQLPRPATRLEHGKGRVVRALVLVAMLAVTLVLGYGYPLLSKGAEWLDVQWRYPYVLWLLLLVPLVLWRGYVWRRPPGAASSHGHHVRLRQGPPGRRPDRKSVV